VSAVCCSVLQCVAVRFDVLQSQVRGHTCECSVLQCVAVCCSALQCVSMCCSHKCEAALVSAHAHASERE